VDSVQAIRIIALKDVMCDEPSPDAQWYRLTRWYSKTFATPLHEVDNLPKLDLIRAWFNERYENLDDAELHKELQEVLNPEEPLQKSLHQTQDDAAVDKLMEKVKAQNKAAAAKPKAPPVDDKIPKGTITDELLESIDGLGKALESLKDLEPAVKKEEGFDLDFSGLT
jgi:hypothetical protein